MTTLGSLRAWLRTLPLLLGAGIFAAALASACSSDHVAGLLLRAGIGAALVLGGCAMTITSLSSHAPSWNMKGAMIFFVVVVLGADAATLGAPVGVLLYCLLLERSPLRRAMLNWSCAAITAAAGSLAFAGFGGSVGELSMPVGYLPLLATVVAVALANDLTIGVYSLGASERLRTGLRNEAQALRDYLPATVMENVVGMTIATIWLVQPWVTPILLPLAFSFFIAMRRGARVQQVTESALESFANIVDERDRYTFEHSTRVCDYSMKIGAEMELTEKELQALYWTSRLHDLGKVAVDNAILNKPGKLTDEEFEVMKSHPVVSARILSSFSFDEKDTEVVLCHHERYDGRGYLRREAETVPLEAYIIAVADTYDAMTSDRPYRKGLSSQTALQEIERNIGTQFHPDCARAFLAVMEYQPEVAPADGERTPELGSAGTSERALDGALVVGDDVRQLPEAA